MAGKGHFRREEDNKKYRDGYEGVDWGKKDLEDTEEKPDTDTKEETPDDQ